MATASAHRSATIERPLTAKLRVLDMLNEKLGLPHRQVAQIVGVNESTLHRWRSGDSTPSPSHIRTLGGLAEFTVEFHDMFGRAIADGREWLQTPLPALGGREPLSLLLEGRVERVTALLGRANRGEPA